MYLIGEDDEPLQRTKPMDVGLSKREPREYAMAIRQHQATNAQVAAHRYAPVIIAKMRVGKPQIIV